MHRESVDSTMDEARREAANFDFLLVTADQQIHGRGTRGRLWHSPSRNVHLTVAIRRKLLSNARMGLLPLEAGVKLWEAANQVLPPPSRSGLRLKWPNDLLWQGKKTAGMLVEVSGDFLYIGAGVNVVHAPDITDGGTPSSCLVEAGADPDCGPDLAESFFSSWLEEIGTHRGNVLQEWNAKALWNARFRMRDRNGNPEVQPVEVNEDGHLKVRFADGREEWLVSEYLV